MWAEQQGWTFPLLSDFWPHGEVAKRYGAFNEALGCANRVTVVVGKDGVVVDRFESEGLGTARPTALVLTRVGSPARGGAPGHPGIDCRYAIRRTEIASLASFASRPQAGA